MPIASGKQTTSTARPSARSGVAPIRADYKVKREQDGRVRVFGVPVFGENVRDFGDQVVGYDLKWLNAAIAFDTQLRSEGYRAPIHFGHHEPGVDRERAGEFELRGCARRLYSGKPTWILYADLVFDDQEKFSRFSKEYVYRSVEISPEKPDEINSLALLASEAPYFRFPVPKQFTFAYRALAGGGRAFLWRFPMATPRGYGNSDVNAPGATGTGISQEAPSATGAPQGNPTDASGGNGNGSDGSADRGGQAYDADGGGDAGADAGAVDFAAYMKKCDARFARMEAALFGDDAGDDAGSDDSGDDAGDSDSGDFSTEGGETYDAGAADEKAGSDDADTKAPGVKKKQATSPVVAAAARQARARGENMALKARLDQIEGELNRERMFAKFSVELAPWLTTPQLRNELKKCVQQGEVSVRAFATGLRSVKPARPRASEGAPHENVQDPPEVAKYAAGGPAKLAEARRFSAVFNDKPKDHFVRRHGLEAWLRNNVGEV